MISLTRFSNLLATFFGIGSINWLPAPGSVVSFLSIILWYFLSVFLSVEVLFFLFIFFIGLACYVCHETNKCLDIHDHRCIVLDEFIGMWCVLIISPDIMIYDKSYLLIVVGFLNFRAFDIYKPWPIVLIHKNIKNGIGIVFDDILAGVMTIVVLSLVNFFLCNKM